MAFVNARKLFSLAVRGEQPPIDCPVSLETIGKNADKVIKNAELARSSLQKFNDAFATRLDMDPGVSVVMGPVKEKNRIIQKAIARYNCDVTQVSDVARSRIRLDNPAQVKKAKDELNSPEFKQSLNEKGITILSVEDFFENPTPTGWRALVIKVEIDLGKGRTQKAESVMLPRGWYDDYKTTHTYLENIRALKDNARAHNRELNKQEEQQVTRYTTMACELHDNLAKRDGYAVLSRSYSTRIKHLELAPGGMP